MGLLSIANSEQGEHLFIACGQELKGVSQNGELTTFTIPPTIADEEGNEKEKCENGTTTKTDDEQASGRLLAICVSPSGRLVAALNDRKMACVWCVAGGGWLGCWRTARRAGCLCFSREEDALLVADKSGDVYRCSVRSPSEKPELILGHISMVLDMLLTSDGSRLVTCDRDEKVRVSRYPAACCIDAYCLGHTEFVTSLCLTRSSRLVSAGGDMTVRLWDTATGRQLACASVATDSTDSSSDDRKVAVTAMVAVETDCDCLLVVQVHSWRRLAVFSVSSDDQLTARLAVPLAAPARALAAAGRRLYVLTPPPAPAPVTVYTPAAGREVALTSLPETQLTAAAGRLWPQMEGSHEEEDVSWLFKQWFDNVSGYLSRKEERLKGDKVSQETTTNELLNKHSQKSEEATSKRQRTMS